MSKMVLYCSNVNQTGTGWMALSIRLLLKVSIVANADVYTISLIYGIRAPLLLCLLRNHFVILGIFISEFPRMRGSRESQLFLVLKLLIFIVPFNFPLGKIF